MPSPLVSATKVKVCRADARKDQIEIPASQLEPGDWIQVVVPGSDHGWSYSVDRITKTGNEDDVYRFTLENGDSIDLPSNAYILGAMSNAQVPDGPCCIVNFLHDAATDARHSLGRRESSRRPHSITFQNIPSEQKEELRKALRIEKSRIPTPKNDNAWSLGKVFYTIEEAVECYRKATERLPDIETVLAASASLIGDYSAKRIFSAWELYYSKGERHAIRRIAGSFRKERISSVESVHYTGTIVDVTVCKYNNIIANGFVLFDVPKLWTDD